jgi:hypothetical protein
LDDWASVIKLTDADSAGLRFSSFGGAGACHEDRGAETLPDDGPNGAPVKRV